MCAIAKHYAILSPYKMGFNFGFTYLIRFRNLQKIKDIRLANNVGRMYNRLSNSIGAEPPH